MKYQITIIPGTTPIFEFQLEQSARIVAKYIATLLPFGSINIWEFDESISQTPLGDIVENPTSLIGCWEFGKYQKIDWRRG